MLCGWLGVGFQRSDRSSRPGTQLLVLASARRGIGCPGERRVRGGLPAGRACGWRQPAPQQREAPCAYRPVAQCRQVHARRGPAARSSGFARCSASQAWRRSRLAQVASSRAREKAPSRRIELERDIRGQASRASERSGSSARSACSSYAVLQLRRPPTRGPADRRAGSPGQGCCARCRPPAQVRGDRGARASHDARTRHGGGTGCEGEMRSEVPVACTASMKGRGPGMLFVQQEIQAPEVKLGRQPV